MKSRAAPRKPHEQHPREFCADRSLNRLLLANASSAAAIVIPSTTWRQPETPLAVRQGVSEDMAQRPEDIDQAWVRNPIEA